MADSTSKVQVHKGSFFGGGKSPLKQYGTHEPGVKENFQDWKKRERSAQSQDEIFREEQDQRSGIQRVQTWREDKERELNQRYRETQTGQFTNKQLNRTAARARLASMRLKKKGKTKRANVAKYAAARVKVTAANGWIVSWVMFWYFMFQLPFAIFSAIGFGIAGVVLSYAQKIEESSIAGKWLVKGLTALADFAYGSVDAAIEAITKLLFGVGVNPLAIFLIPFVLIFILGILQLLLCWFIYSIAGIKSLSGQASSAKQITFILAAIGTALPILNLFPLILIWTMVVWAKPR